MSTFDHDDPTRSGPARPELAALPAAMLGRLVRRSPAAIVTGVLVLSAVLAVFAGQARTATGMDGMTPEAPEVEAAEMLADHFGSNREEVLTVLVRAPRGELAGVDGATASLALEQALHASDASGYLADRDDRPGVISWLTPVTAGLTAAEVAELDDATVRAAYDEALTAMSPDDASALAGLLPAGEDLVETDTALLLAFLEVDSLPQDDVQTYWDELGEIQSELAAAVAVADAELPAGFSAQAVSQSLLFTDLDDFDAELGRLFTGAFGIIVVILAFVYWVRPGAGMNRVRAGRRSAADVLLSMATIVMAVLWMMGAGTLLGPDGLGVIGHLSQFAQVLPVLLIGLGVDYAIHLTSRYREELGTGQDVSGAVQRAVGTVGGALVLATLATALGFLTNLTSPMGDLRDFGLLAAIGITSSFLLMLTFVPAARLLLDRRAERTGRLAAGALGRSSERLLPALMGRTAVLARRAPVVTVIAAALLAGVGGYGMTQLETRFSNLDMVPEESPALAAFTELGERFNGGFDETTELLLTGDVATADTHNALIDAHERLADAPHVALPGGRPATLSTVTAIAALVVDGPDGHPIEPELAAVAEVVGLRPDGTVPSGADVGALYAAFEQAVPDVAGQVLASDGDGGWAHARVAVQTMAGEEGGAELADGLRDAFAPVTGAGVEVIPTSEPILLDVVVEALRESQTSSLAIALLAAMALLVVVFGIERRRPLLGVLTIVPVVLVVVWTFALMAVTGIPFGPITATIAALAIGIGLPYAIHVTHRFLEDREVHADAGAAITATLRNTGGAMAGSAFTTVAGFGILITSSLLPFRQFGQVTVYAVGLSLIAATLVLPSLLVLWDRWHRRRTGLATEQTVDEQPALAGI